MRTVPPSGVEKTAAMKLAMTGERKAAFLGELAQHGVVARAARSASPHSEDGCVQSFRDERERDEVFAEAWDEAMEQARGKIEFEIHRRAVEGYEEAIYGGRYREKVVGTVRRYSDRLLELRAKALLPEYRERRQVELGGGLDMKHGPSAEALAAREVAYTELRKLNREQREEMRQLLLRAQSILGGSPGSPQLEMQHEDQEVR